MADQSSNPFNLPPMVVVGLIVAAIGAFTFNQRPFQDARPSESHVPIYRHAPTEDQDVEARLWEDPLAAAATAREADDKRAQLDRQACFDELLAISKLSVSAPRECAQTSIELRHSLALLGKSLVASGAVGGSLMVTGALVSGAPYADDMETRRRTRYAILSGLYRTGYVPVNHEHIGYVILSELYDTVAGHDIAAYELFESSPDPATGTKTYVLLMWLDQDGFRDRPLSLLSSLVSKISPHRADGKKIAPVSVAIIGPADSDGLRSMATELANDFNREMGETINSNSSAKDNPCLTRSHTKSDVEKQKIQIYSSRATADDEDLFEAAVGTLGAQSGVSLAQDFNCWSPNVHLYRTVASDKQTADRLWAELHYRGVHDYNDLVLITERDSLYSRLIGKYFGGCKNPPGPDPGSDAGEDSKPHPLCMTYLRGLDGLTPPTHEPTFAPSKHAQDTSTLNPRTDAVPVASEAASGSGQLDYLRRLAGSLNARQGGSDCISVSKLKNAACAPREIKAVGIIGGDIYDKLLVLQALRDTFPRATFFTFDMDARLFETQNLQWTRQILVGSSIGLALRQELQGDVPPFRDTYQTTAFFSTMLAIHRTFGSQRLPKSAFSSEENGGLGWTHSPRIFEIGRSRPFDLTNDTKIETGCDFDGDCESLAASRATSIFFGSMPASETAIALVVAILTFVLFWVSMGSERMMRAHPIPLSTRSVRKTTLTAIVSVGCAVTLVVFWNPLIRAITHDDLTVPAPIFSGASPWASNLFELLSVVAVIVLVARGQRKLGDNAEKIRAEFGLQMTCEDMVKWSTVQIHAWPRRARLKEFFWFPFSRLSGHAASLPSGEVSALEALLAQYLHRGTPLARLVRVAFATLLATSILYKLESIPSLPLGGGIPQFDAASIDQWFGSSISLLSLFAMQFLVFWVADAVLLSRSFLLALQHLEPQWPAQALAREHGKVNLPADEATIWLNLQLVARRTQWVANLIWYPSCVIAAMFIAAITVQFGKFRFADNPIALTICTAFIVIAVWQIRRSAETWRADVIDNLEDRRLRSLAVDVGATAALGSITQLDRLLDRVSNLRDGAFAPLSAQPVVRAVLLPLFTYGATLLLQYSRVS
jgi:hypothetical protein